MLTYLRILILTLLAFSGIAQTKCLNYHAIIVNQNPLDIPGNTVANLPYSSAEVCVKFTLCAHTGQIEYVEVQCTQTDSYGLVNLNIGAGSKGDIHVLSNQGKFSTFDAVIWDTHPKKLKVDVSFDQGKTFSTVSEQALNYSAYALYAESVDYQNVRSAPTKLSQFTDDIQTVKLNDLEPIKAEIVKNKLEIQQVLSNNAQTSNNVAIINQSISELKLLDDVQNRRLDQIVTQSNAVNGVISNLNLSFEQIQNKSTATNLGGTNPSDGSYPSQRAVKTYIDAQTTPNATSAQLGKIQLTGDLGGTASSPTVPGLSSKENSTNKSTSITLGTSDVLFPTQNAVKTYVDNQYASGTIADASSLTKGKIQLAGDLSGTADAPVIATGAITSAKILDGTIDTGDLKDASITTAKIVGIDGSKVSGNIGGNATNITASSNTSLTSLANLSTVGTVSTGTWNGSTITVPHGGTGVSSMNGLVRGNGTGALSTAAYGSFYDVTSQYAVAADSATAMKLSMTDFASGVSIVNNTQIRPANTGVYNIQFSAQIDRSAGTNTQFIMIWLRKNGVNIPDSSTEIVISGGVSVAATVASWNFFQSLTAGDLIEIMWSVTNPQLYISYTPERITPRRPAIPSLIVTVNQVY